MNGLEMHLSVANPLQYLEDMDKSYFDELLVLPEPTRPVLASKPSIVPLSLPPPMSNTLPPLLPNYQVAQVSQLTLYKKRALDDEHPYFLPPKRVQPSPAVLEAQPMPIPIPIRVASPLPTIEPSENMLSQDGTDVLEEQRKERNRKHAKKSRQRRKSLTEDLQHSLSSLKAENSKLREALYRQIDKPMIDIMVQSKLSKPTDQFIDELKRYSRKQAMDAKTRACLKTLSKTAAKCADEFRNTNHVTDDETSSFFA